MKKIFFTFSLLLLIAASLYAQEKRMDIVVLNTGNTYVGSIVVQNDDIVILQTNDGTRFQFSNTEIKEIKKNEIYHESDDFSQKESPEILDLSNDNIRMMINVSGGASFAEKAFSLSPSLQAGLLFVKDNIFGKALLGGVEIAYQAIFLKEENTESQTISFLPLSLHLQYNFSSKRHHPFVGIDTGYAFSLSEAYKGGISTKISAGYSYRLSYRTVLYTGFYYGLQMISTNLTENFNKEEYNYFGKTVINNFGIKLALQF